MNSPAVKMQVNSSAVAPLYSRWLPLAAIGLGILFYGQFLYLHALNIPFSDDVLDVLKFLSGLVQTDDPNRVLDLVLAQHNDHRTSSSRLLYLLIYTIGGEIDFRTLTFLANCALPLILLMMYMAVRDHFAPWVLMLPVALVLFQLRAYSLTLWSMAAFAYFYVFLYGFASLLLLRNVSRVRFIFAVIMAILATFTLASGQMVWLVGLASLLRQRQAGNNVSSAYVILWLAATVAVMMLWRWGLETPNTLLYVLQAFAETPAHHVLYFLTLMGSSLTQSSVGLAAVGGGMMLLFLCYSTYRNWAQNNILVELFAWYVVLSILAMTLGRALYADIEYALSSRYSFPSIVMLASICLLLFYRLDRRYFRLTLIPIVLAGVYCISSYAVYAERLQSEMEDRVQRFNQKNYWVYGRSKKETNPIVKRAIKLGIYTPPPRPYPQPTIYSSKGSSSAPSKGAARPEKVRPNILLIMVDDLGFNDLGINNNNQSITTPNLDALARNGVRFTRHYAYSVCSPARAALLTGQYPERNGYMPNGRGLSPQLITLPEALQSAGYQTWHIGKWHIGDIERQAWPDYQGFDHWFGFLSQWRLAGKTDSSGEIKLTKPRYKKPWLESDSEPGKFYPGHLEDILTNKTIAVIDELRSTESPWFINLWFYAPHAPIEPGKKFAKLYPDTGAGRYRALVHQLDHNIGRVLRYLDRVDQRDNTIVIVVSDNGGTNSEIDNNFPYFGPKGTFFEGGVRTPLIIQWPDSKAAGAVFDDVISMKDIYPTLLDSIDIKIPPGLDGRSLYRAIMDPQRQVPGKALMWESTQTNNSVLSADARWKLVQYWPFSDELAKPHLYDLASFPYGDVTASPPPAGRVEALLSDFQAWQRDVHRVKIDYQINLDEGNTLTGMDFLRTPGFGRYTFGLGFSGDIQGSLVKQEGVWQMTLVDGAVHVSFGDIKLVGAVTQIRHCHRIIVSGVFKQYLSSFSGPAETKLSLYIDGEHQQTVEVPRAIGVGDVGRPTEIGEAAGALSSEGNIYRPVVLNVAIEESAGWTLDSLGYELCPTQ